MTELVSRICVIRAMDDISMVVGRDIKIIEDMSFVLIGVMVVVVISVVGVAEDMECCFVPLPITGE